MQEDPEETGGAAFPTVTREYNLATGQWDIGPTVEGMTLRDHFAGRAMQGFATVVGEFKSEPLWDVMANDAYRFADAMIKARK